ncbi:MAG: nuclease [Chloroflexaceae bacterium]|nr:nuclease [Chloroflexaceae bacterium]
MHRVLFFLLTISMLFLISCGTNGTGETSPGSQPDSGEGVSTEAVARASIADYPEKPADLADVPVVKVVDGDTVDVLVDGEELRLRLIGMNTPETVDPRRPVECFGREASNRAKALLENQTVQLEIDPTQGEVDRYGRGLAYIWMPDGRLFNLEMIAQGFAFEYTYRTPYIYQEQFQAAQQAAREAEIGLWAPNTCDGQSIPVEEASVAAPTPAVPPAAPQSNLEPSFDGCQSEPNAASAPNTPVVIVTVDKAAETVTLQQRGDVPVDLNGWTMCSMRGSQIHSGLEGVLQPGETKTFAHTGSGNIWSNNEQDDGALYDATGRLVSYWVDQ